MEELVKELKRVFNRNYSHITLELTDVELKEFISQQQRVSTSSIEILADLLSDYILSQGLGDVQE